MPLWRRFPPVYAPLRLRALLGAAGAVRGAAAHEARDRATVALQAAYPGYRAILLDSGTSALSMALQVTHREGSNAIVALPAYACPDLGGAAIGAKARVRLYDVDPHTLQPDWHSLETQLREGATHVVAAHLFGRLVDVPRVLDMASRYGAAVVEDAAQHAGGTLHGVRGGALAPVAILSFGRGKGLNAGGGGALLLADGYASAHRHLRPDDQRDGWGGVTRLAVAAVAEYLSRPLLYRVPSAIPALGLGATEYHAPRAASPLPGTSASLLVEALGAEPGVLAARQRVEAGYRSAIPTNWQLALLDGCASGALRFPIRLPLAKRSGQANTQANTHTNTQADAQASAQASTQFNALAAFGMARSYPRTLAEYPEIAARLVAPSHIPGAQELAATLHTLPTHALLRDSDRGALLRLLLNSGDTR